MGLPVVGLTGGIASGKSCVARQFASLGAAVLDADQLAREIVEPGQPALEQLVGAFGQGILSEDGTLNRALLGSKVFDDKAARAVLNGITHPRIAALSTERMSRLQDSGAPYVLYEAALLVENGSYRSMDALIVVSTTIELQRERVQVRDRLTPEAAMQRINAQSPLERKLEVADYIIENNGSLPDLLDKVQQVHARVLQRFPGATSRR